MHDSELLAKAGRGLAAEGYPEAAFSAEFGRQDFHTGGYAEPMSTGNPFEATILPARDRMDIGKLRAQVTRSLTPELDGTLWIAVAKTLSASTSLHASVTGFGALAPASKNPVWAEYGARIGYKLTGNVTVDAFANGISGNQGLGTRLHVGADLRWRF